MRYIAIDGDNIGRKIEYFILMEKMKELSAYSKNYKKSMKWLANQLKKTLKAEIIFIGGDSVLAVTKQVQIKEQLSVIKSTFSKKGKNTFSCGIGNSSQKAYLALKIAKSKGKNTVYEIKA